MGWVGLTSVGQADGGSRIQACVYHRWECCRCCPQGVQELRVPEEFSSITAEVARYGDGAIDGRMKFGVVEFTVI